MKLSKIIEELENKGAIKRFYLHREYYTGKLELNIEFDNEKADDILNKSNIQEADTCAFWE